jgi:hypothetical protein
MIIELMFLVSIYTLYLHKYLYMFVEPIYTL